MFDKDYELLKAQALAGYDRSARKASDVSEKTRIFQTTCDSRKLKKINGGKDARPSTEEEEEEEEENQEASS